MNKAQRLFKKWDYYNIPENNSSKEYKEYHRASRDLLFYLTSLAAQGKLYVRTTSGWLENVSTKPEHKFVKDVEVIDDVVLYKEKVIRDMVANEKKNGWH